MIDLLLLGHLTSLLRASSSVRSQLAILSRSVLLLHIEVCIRSVRVLVTHRDTVTSYITGHGPLAGVVR